MLLGLGIARMWTAANRPGEPTTSPADVVVDEPEKSSSAAGRQPLADSSETAWNDSLDDQITQLSQDISRLQPGWSDRSGPVDALQYGVQKIQQEMEEDKL